jgi:ribose 5-phosphate isomerase RpiB
VRAKCHALFIQLAQFAEAEDLKPTGVGEDRAAPRHKTVQAAQFTDGFDARAQVQVIGVPENDVSAEFFERVLRHSLD